MEVGDVAVGEVIEEDEAPEIADLGVTGDDDDDGDGAQDILDIPVT